MALITITLSRDILEKSKNCGLLVNNKVEADCAIQTFLSPYIPNALVDYDGIKIYQEDDAEPIYLDLPDSARDFVRRFDERSPKERALMKEFSFDLEIDDALIENFGIETLSLHEASFDSV